MSMEREPEDELRQLEDQHAIAVALKRATENLASYLIAEELGLNSEETERLIDAMYDQLREDLSKQRLLQVVLDFLMPDAKRRAQRLVRQFRKLPEVTR